MSAACDRTVDLLSEGAELDAEAQAHLRECQACHALVGDDEALASVLATTSSPAPAMSSALEALASQPVRPSPLRAPIVRTLAALAPAVALTGGIVLVAVRRDFSTLSWMARWAPVLSLATLAVVGVALAAGRGRESLGLAPPARVAVAVATVAVFELLALTLGERPIWGGETSHHIACALSGSALPWALVPLTLLALRRTDPVRPALTGAAVGAAVAAITAIIQHLECASPSLFHTAVTHAASFVVCPILGAWLGRRWLAP